MAKKKQTKRLPEFKVLTIWYDENGKITNLKEVLEEKLNYFVETGKVIKSDWQWDKKEENKEYWVELLIRLKPKVWRESFGKKNN